VSHWLAVTSAENWARCLAAATWGVKDRFTNNLKQVALGDDVLVHVVGMRSAGIFRVTHPYFYSEDPIWPDDVYPHRIRFEPAIVPPEPVDIKPVFSRFFPSISPGGYFRTSFRRLPDEDYELFRDFLEEGEVQTLEFSVEKPEPQPEFALSLERDLEDYLEGNLQVIESGLKLYVEGALKGRQFGTDVNRIDLLAQDGAGNLVVIELKAGEAGREVLGQILPYMGWVREHLAKGKAVRGIVVASDFTSELLAAINVLSNFALYRYAVQFTLKKVAPVAPMTR